MPWPCLLAALVDRWPSSPVTGKAISTAHPDAPSPVPSPAKMKTMATFTPPPDEPYGAIGLKASAPAPSANNSFTAGKLADRLASSNGFLSDSPAPSFAKKKGETSSSSPDFPAVPTHSPSLGVPARKQIETIAVTKDRQSTTLGVTLHIEEGGPVTVEFIKSDSLLARSGLKLGDTVTHVNGIPVASAVQVSRQGVESIA